MNNGISSSLNQEKRLDHQKIKCTLDRRLLMLVDLPINLTISNLKEIISTPISLRTVVITLPSPILYRIVTFIYKKIEP